MIGCILTGHGSFATGLSGALEMIAGQQENFETVCFLEEKSLEAFSEDMRQAMSELRQKCSGVIVFSDLLGGTPFRTAMIEAQAFEDVEVIAGANLPILLESMVLRYGAESLADFIAMALEAGKNGLVHAQLPQESEMQTVDDEEGGI
ncbi:PTS mannose transporter subunit IIA [Bacilli bacterium]|nr:PTS mannose transporter subunit IIA [Bacilli bacterium]